MPAPRSVPESMKQTSLPLLPIGGAVLAAAYLLPQGDAPWYSFWHEWVAAAGVLLMAVALLKRLATDGRPIRFMAGGSSAAAGVAFVLAGASVAQAAAGQVAYHGDAILVAACLIGFASCEVLARSQSHAQRDALVDVLAAVFAAAAVLSLPIAFGQWLNLLQLDLGMPVAGGRPIGHLEQANLFCSLLMLGVLGLWRLRERGRLPLAVTFVLAVLLVLAIGLTQSRVAWIVALVVAGVTAARGRRLALGRRTGVVIALAALLFATVWLVPWIDQATGLQGASLAERSSGGRRPEIWRLFALAILRRPWLGWGVQSNGAAQYALADDFDSFGYVLSSAHDLPLDLMLWFGLPLGALASVVLYATAASRWLRARDAASHAAATMVSVLPLHALVEFPLHYAYFLLPLGLLLGATSSVAEPAPSPVAPRRAPLAPRAVLGVVTVGAIVLLAVLPREYTALTDNRPLLATDPVSKHDALIVQGDPPDVLLLDQLQGFHRFAEGPVRGGLSPAALDALRVPLLRFPYGPAVERYARVMALNGRDTEARNALRRVCKFETSPQCLGAQLAWSEWQWAGEPLPDWP